MKAEPTRVRQHGTKVTAPASPDERIKAIRSIVTNGQYAKVDGQMIDLFSAGAIMSVYDRLNDDQRARYAVLTAPRMAQIAFKLIK